MEFVGNPLASHFLAEVGTNVCLFATGTVRANMTESISRSSFAQTCSRACLLDLFMVWHAYFPVSPVMFRPCLHVLISCAIDCMACLLSGHLCRVQVLPASFKKSCLVCLACLVGMFNFTPKRYEWINEVTVGFTHFGVVEFVGNTFASHFFAEVGMNIFG